MSVFKDTRTLVDRTVKMVKQISEGQTVEVNDTGTLHNGYDFLDTYLCDPVFVDKNNYKEILIDSGYYTEDMLK
jgi:putative multiple sugar transport system substrate-binding protein